MDTKAILAELKAERNRIDTVIQALEAIGASKAESADKKTAPVTTNTRRKRSAAARRKMALAQQARWARIRKIEAAKTPAKKAMEQ